MSVSVDIENKGYYFKSSSDESMHFKSTYDDKKFITFVIEITTTWREMCKIRKVLRFLDKSPVPLMVICSIESGYLINIKSIMKIIPDDYDIEAALSKLFIPVLHCSPALLQQTAHSSLEELKCIRILDFIPLFNKLKDDGIECFKETLHISRYSVRLIRPVTVVRNWCVSLTGKLFIHLYTDQKAKCILCSKCESFLGVNDFLSHSHGLRQSGVGHGAAIDFYSGSRRAWNIFNRMRTKYENDARMNVAAKSIDMTDFGMENGLLKNCTPKRNVNIISQAYQMICQRVYNLHSFQFLMRFYDCPFLIMPISFLDYLLSLRTNQLQNTRIFAVYDLCEWEREIKQSIHTRSLDVVYACKV
ncbi:hypothetical protein GJ496_008323 [Pomphorhynchus laevis]|nr:hypothetical protein GJ496_008323 [Pomphorhynchus laevis]